MSKKSRISVGVLFICMVAVILFSQGFENPVADPKDEKVQEEIKPEEQDQNVSTKEELPVILNQDIYVGEEERKKETDEEQVSKKELEAEVKEAMKITNPKITVSANAALLMKASNKEVLYQQNGLEKIQPASTAKLLTAILAVELSDEDEEFLVGSEIDLIALDSSRAYLKKGQRLSLEQILDALLLPSGNDTAYVIAANLGRKLAGDSEISDKKAVKRFVQEMNDEVVKLGGIDTNFLTPDGYDKEGQYTTAYDMALIGIKALEYDEISRSVSKTKARNILLSGEDVTWRNSNKLIQSGSGYYYKYAIGLKTGTSKEAGRCLVSAAKKDKEVYVSVIMNASPEGRWKDSIALLSYAVKKEE